jgi:hypothetical protein
MSTPHSLIDCFKSAIYAMAVRLPIGFLFLVYFLLVIKNKTIITPTSYWEFLIEYFSTSTTLIYWIVM